MNKAFSTLKAAPDRIWSPICNAFREASQARHYPLGYTPALDGLRGLMTLGVFVAHVHGTIPIPGASLFLDIFFVMSGYFITSLLLRDVVRRGAIDYREFYRRRFARILPPFAAMVVAYLSFGCLVASSCQRVAIDSLIGFSYLANWWRAFDLPGVFFMGHTWSLAVEEQFYLLWPVAFALLVRRFGVSWKLAGAIVVIASAFWCWRIWLTWSGAPYARLYNGLDTRADALMVGCALAVVLKLVPPGMSPKLDRALPRLAWPLLAFLALAVAFIGPGRLYVYAGSALCGALGGALLVTVLIRCSGTVFHSLLQTTGAVFVGRIFYGIYLWHFPILSAMQHYGATELAQYLIGLPLTLLCATLSYVYLERRFMRVRSRDRAPTGVAMVTA